MAEEKTSIKFNGFEYEEKFTDEEIVGLLFHSLTGRVTKKITQMEIMSPDALREFIKNIMEMAIELRMNKKIVNNLKKMNLAAERTYDKNMMSLIMESILKFEGLGTLRGFGIAQCESHRGGGKRVIRNYEDINPEKYSIR